MTRAEFNEKYKAYIEPGFEKQGLEFDVPSCTIFLDSIFRDLIMIPGFTYSQIKFKFGMCRFYTNLESSSLTYLIEGKINELTKDK